MRPQIGWSSCRRFLAALLAGLLTASTSFAQAGLGDWHNVRKLSVDAPIVVKTVAGQKYSGHLVNVTADALVLFTDERSFAGRVRRRRSLRRQEVREVRLWAQTASMLATGGIGAGVGAGIGGAIEASAKNNEDRGVALAVLTILGFTLGLLIGRHAHLVKGKLVYRAPADGGGSSRLHPPNGSGNFRFAKTGGFVI